eukprot:4770518-Karenia_brevis.AAC.1
MEIHRDNQKAEHASEVAELHERIADMQSEVNSAKVWPVVSVRDEDMAKHIRIECPGVEEESIDIHSLPNGVHVEFQY